LNDEQGRQTFELQKDGEIDIVIATSDNSVGGLGVRYMRLTTAVGNVRAAVTLVETVGRYDAT
jgi:hypothetical protein